MDEVGNRERERERMATSAFPSLSTNKTTHHHHHRKLPIFRKQSRLSYKTTSCCSGNEHHQWSHKDTTILGKRELLLYGVSSMLLSSSAAAKELKMVLVVDHINAYSFNCPLEMPSNSFVFKWVESRKPERYSSAAPLSPDARQRIVSERVDIIDNLIISVSIGPPNPQFLKSNDKNTWDAKDVADSVLSDKSALRVTSAQRKAESSVLDTHVNKINGEPYWYYEYLVRKSPTNSAQESNLYRHYVASTAERDGYLYSLNASTLSKKWQFMGPVLKETVASFQLLPPTNEYVPPFKDPWRFW